MRELCAAQLVICSPLTRALQTCFIGLHQLLAARGLPVVLKANAREKLNAGGADSLGVAVGEAEIRARVAVGMKALYPFDEGRVAEACAPKLDDAEVRSRWWSLLPESGEEVGARLAELLRQIRYCDEERIVLVGHSHFFREMFRQLLDERFAASHAELVGPLRRMRLSNCGVAALDLCFDADDDTAKGVITDVRLILDTEIVP